MALKIQPQAVKRLTGLALPLAFAHLCNLLMPAVDTYFAAQVSKDVLGGISIGNAAFSSLLVFGVGLLLGLDSTVSYCFGAKDHQKGLRYFAHALVIAFVAATALSALLYGFVFLGLPILGFAPEIAGQTAIYLKVAAITLIPLLVFIAFRQYLQALGVGGPILIILVIINLLNAALNYLFVWGTALTPRLGILGSAVSTLCSQIIALCLIFYLWIKVEKKFEKSFSDLIQIQFQKEVFIELLQIGVPAGFYFLLEVGVFATSVLIAGKFGAVQLGAHQLVLQLSSLTFMIPFGIGAAGSVIVGQYRGEKNLDQAYAVGSMAIVFSIFIMSIFSGIFWFFGKNILSLLTSDVDILETALIFIQFAAFYQIFDGVQAVSAGVLRGAGITKITFYSNLFGHWFIGFPVALMCAFWWKWNVAGVWTGLSLGLVVVSGVLSLYWFKKGRALL